MPGVKRKTAILIRIHSLHGLILRIHDLYSGVGQTNAVRRNPDNSLSDIGTTTGSLCYSCSMWHPSPQPAARDAKLRQSCSLNFSSLTQSEQRICVISSVCFIQTQYTFSIVLINAFAVGATIFHDQAHCIKVPLESTHMAQWFCYAHNSMGKQMGKRHGTRAIERMENGRTQRANGDVIRLMEGLLDGGNRGAAAQQLVPAAAAAGTGEPGFDRCARDNDRRGIDDWYGPSLPIGLLLELDGFPLAGHEQWQQRLQSGTDVSPTAICNGMEVGACWVRLPAMLAWRQG